MIVYRALSLAELEDIRTAGRLRPGPPSFQGKWTMIDLHDAAEMGRQLFELDGEAIHIVELEWLGEDNEVFAVPNCDRIGPACFFEPGQLDRLRFIREVSDVPLGEP